MTAALPSAVQSGVRAASVDGATIVDDPLHVDGRWAFVVNIDVGNAEDAPSSRVPERSKWFAVVDDDYPFGSVNIYPSKTSCIACTFEHQEINLAGNEGVPWRTGKICLDTPVRRFGFAPVGNDPIGDREERLKWHLARAVAWTRDARAGELVHDGDPFELPYYPTNGAIRVVHDESPASFDAWNDFAAGSWGQIVWDEIPGIEKTVVAVAFTAGRDRRRWVRVTARFDSERHTADRDRRTGIWWLWPAPIVLDPWQVPLTWGDLRAAGKPLGINVDECLREIARSIRGEPQNMLLFGYPIPLRQGEPPSEVHWQAVLLPKLEKYGKPPNGFRPNDTGWWQRDRTGAFSGDQDLEYLPTKSWHPDRVQARGRYGQRLRGSRLAVVGCGALGSLLTELLIRGGLNDVLLIDHDTLIIGNLVRHTLSARDLGKNKATALAAKMGAIAPFSSVRPYANCLPTNRVKLSALLEDREIILDCTGADDALVALGSAWWSVPRLFVSASVGYEAKRVFVFAHRGHSFPYVDFRQRMNPHLSDERAHWSERGETLEGAGCWSPLFPARMDDLMLSAVSCGKVLEELIDHESVHGRLVIFEQSNEPSFSGLRLVKDTDS